MLSYHTTSTAFLSECPLIFTFQKIDLKSRKAAKQLINTETPLTAPMKSDLNFCDEKTQKGVQKKRMCAAKNSKIKTKTKAEA